MTYSPRVADLTEAFDTTAIQRALEIAYARGFQDGKDAFKKAVLNMDAPAPEAGGAESVADDSNPEDDGKRAPRGLTRAVITHLLKLKGAMTMADIQREAVALDRRVSPKTVYNELRREDGQVYRYRNDLWSLVGERPVEHANLFVANEEEESV